MNPWHTELLNQDLRNFLGECFHQLEAAFFNKTNDALRNGLVIQRVADIVRFCRSADIRGHFKIDNHGLPDFTLPVIDADDGLDGEALKKNDVHGCVWVYSVADKGIGNIHAFILATPGKSEMTIWALIPLAYLMGSVSTAIIVSRLLGLPDPRQQGSKNPGATNVLRLGGKKAAAITLIGDALKGLIPVVIAKALGVAPEILAAVSLAAFLGHLYPIFFGFKGGKGVATALGIFLGLSPWVGLAVLATWLLTAFLFKYSSLAALTAALLSPLYLWFILHSEVLVGVGLTMALLLVSRHRANIERLLKGEESRIGSGKKKKPQDSE
ncbi:MAG: glycerol-3-phosphate 1-O-acyltransferase PlsY [Pseudomonadota bacterium]